MSKKYKQMIILSLLFQNIALATNWDYLITNAENLKIETKSLDEKNFVKADVVKLPNGQYRLIQFSSFLIDKKPTIFVDAAIGTDLNDLCRNSVMFGKPFSAKLILQINPLTNNRKNNLDQIINENIFENRFKLGPARLTFDNKVIGWTLHDSESISKAKGRPLYEYYEDLINDELKTIEESTAIFDLSKLNALACDMMQNRFTFTLTRSIEYETGLPERKPWIEFDLYSIVFHEFWKLQPNVESLNLTLKQRVLADALTTGLAIGSKLQPDQILKSTNRISKLITSLKFKINSDAQTLVYSHPSTLRENWLMTSEFRKPSVLFEKHELILGSQNVNTKFEK